MQRHLHWTRASDETSAIDGTLRVWYRRWHLAFAAIAVVAGLGALLDPGLPATRRAAGTLLLAFLVGWFWFHIVRQFRDGIEERDVVLYLVVAFPVFVLLLNLHPSYYLLAFVAYWQLYAYLSVPIATIGAVLLSAALWFSGDRVEAVSPIPIVIGAVALLVSTMFALYIESIGREAEKRQVLIDELHAARDELAAQQHEAGVLAERARLAGEIH